jgi:hypothetical protein
LEEFLQFEGIEGGCVHKPAVVWRMLGGALRMGGKPVRRQDLGTGWLGELTAGRQWWRKPIL